MKHRFILKRAAAVFIAVILACLSVGMPVSADTSTARSYTAFSGKKVIDGWYPAFISWQEPDKKADFIAACQNTGATIEVTYTGNASISLLLQSFPSGGNHYTWVTYDTSSVKTSGDKKVAVFSASGFLNTYTSKKHEDDGSYLRLDNTCNFGIGGEGNTVYSVIVKWRTDGVPSLSVDLESENQTIQGFGASYTWYGDWVTMTSAANREQIFDWIFKDCEFNVLRFRDLHRVRAYGGSFEDTNYRTRAYKAYYDAAVSRGIDPIVLVTSWGEYRDEDWVQFVDRGTHQTWQGNVPWTYYTLKKDSKGNYRYNDLAKFCVESVKLFNDAGIPVDYFSISNEVELQDDRMDENGNPRDYSGFFFDTVETEYACSYAKAYIAVYDAFQKAFGDKAPKLLAPETMSATPSLIKSYVDPIIKERPETVTDIAHHLYGSANTASDFAQISSMYSGKYSIWQTEWYTNDLFDLSSEMIRELVNENLNVYLYWDGVWIPDNGNCLIEVSNDTPWNRNAYVARRGPHYIMEHFSKYIKNGYIRVDTSSYASGSEFAAFKSPEGDKLVIVALNRGTSSEKLKLDVGEKVLKSKVLRSTINTTDPAQEQKKNSYMKEVKTITTIVLDLETEE